MYHKKIDCNKLKIYSINSKPTTKIEKQRVTANKPAKEIKLNLKNNPKEDRKRGGKNEMGQIENAQQDRFKANYINNQMKYKWSKPGSANFFYKGPVSK